MEDALTRTFSWLKVPTSASTFDTMLNGFQSGDGPYNKSLLCDYKRASCGPSFEALAASRSKQSVSEGEGRWHLVTGFLPPPRLGFQLGDILHRPPVNRCLTYQ